MARKVIGPTGSRRRRWLVLSCLAVTALLAVVFVPSALAVHDLAFQLDGDVSTNAYTTINANQIYDWGGNSAGNSSTPLSSANGLFSVSDNAAANTETVSNNTSLVNHDAVTTNPFLAASFQRDFESGSGCTLNSLSTTFCTADDSTYATGSKDTLGIGNGGWQCNHDNNVNSKIDIMNAYTASYIDPGSGDHIIYFGLEKNKNNGTNDVGVWLLQGSASCSAPSGHVNFHGGHRNKDVLVVSEFSQGGGVSSIKAYQWAANAAFPGDSGCIDSNDWPDPNTNAPGVVPAQKGCNGQPIFSSNADCKVAGAGGASGPDALCATTNANCVSSTLACGKPYNGTVSTPWLTSDATKGVGKNQIVSPDFFEGGIDLNKVFGAATESAPSCFNTVVPDTRSSNTITATLFDFVTNQLGECKTSLSTQQNGVSDPAHPLTIGTGVVQSGTDSATLNITGSNSWGGTLTFYLCGPFTTQAAASCPETLDSNNNPIGNHGVVVNTGGTTVGSGDSSHVYTSPQAYLTSAGWYCWHAHFDPNTDSANAGISAGDDTGSNECFQVAPVTPTLSTTASCSATPCVVGSTLTDYAQLSGTATEPGSGGPGGDTGLYKSIYLSSPSGLTAAGGSISWSLYGPGTGGAAQCTTAISGAPTPSSKLVSGDSTGNGYGPVNYVTSSSDKVGKFEFAASYPGDSPNTSAASDESCDTTGNNGEQVTVTGAATSSSAQRWLPNDTVTLGSTAGTTLNGTLTVTLYKGTYTIANGVCSADNGDTQEKQFSTSVSTATNSFSYSTSNTDFFVGTNPDGSAGGADGQYFWLIHYVDNSITSPNDRCETATISHNDAPSS